MIRLTTTRKALQEMLYFTAASGRIQWWISLVGTSRNAEFQKVLAVTSEVASGAAPKRKLTGM